MKKYHELASIKNGQDIVGFVINQGLKAPRGERATIVDMKTFTELVANNEVQYFQIVNGIPIVKYTDEELRKIKPLSRLYGEEYMRNDLQINYAALKNGPHNTIAISFGGMYSLLDQFKVAIFMYSNIAFTREFINGIKKNAAGGFTRLAENAYIGIVNPVELLGYLRWCKRDYDINFDLMRNFDGIQYKRKLAIGYKNVPQESILGLINNIEMMGMVSTIRS